MGDEGAIEAGGEGLERSFDLGHVFVGGVDGGTVLAAHGVRGGAGVGAQMDLRDGEEGEDRRVEGDAGGFRERIVRWVGRGKALVDLRDAAQRLEHGFGAPVAAASEGEGFQRAGRNRKKVLDGETVIE